MSAKYTFRVSNKQQYLNLPLNLITNHVGQEDIINTRFVNEEVEKSVNEIIDYEKVRVGPVDGVDKVAYSINLLNGTNFPTTTTLDTVGFENDDIRFKRNNFKKSFLNLMFFDSDIPTKQNLLSFNTMYNRINRMDMSNTSIDGNPILYGTIKDVKDIPLTFIVEDPIKEPRGFAEGYFLYHPINSLPDSVYMRANYNNAKNGLTTDLVTVDVPMNVNDIIVKLHTKFDLKVYGDTYYYELDTSYSDNIETSEGKLTINLFEIQVL